MVPISAVSRIISVDSPSPNPLLALTCILYLLYSSSPTKVKGPCSPVVVALASTFTTRVCCVVSTGNPVYNRVYENISPVVLGRDQKSCIVVAVIMGDIIFSGAPAGARITKYNFDQKILFYLHSPIENTDVNALVLVTNIVVTVYG